MDQKQKTVLIVEDDKAMRDIVVHKLKLSGFGVLEAEDGKQALDIWQKNKPDLVLLDITLPEIDGVQILQVIRNSEDPIVKGTSVVVLTNLSGKQHQSQMNSLEIDDYLIKAYNTTEEIVDKVTKILAKK